MALLTFSTIESERNIDLTDPQGQSIATALIASVTTWVSKFVGYPIETSSVTSYFENGHSLIYLPTKAPVTDLTLSTYNSLTRAYDALDASLVRVGDNGAVQVGAWLPEGFQAVKAVYTTGWDANSLPKDLRDALIDVVTLKLQQINNLSLDPATYGLTDDQIAAGETAPAGGVSRVQADTYSEEYDNQQSAVLWKAKAAQLAQSLGDDIPAATMEVLNSYKLVFAL